jgi:hypothetical protein
VLLVVVVDVRPVKASLGTQVSSRGLVSGMLRDASRNCLFRQMDAGKGSEVFMTYGLGLISFLESEDESVGLVGVLLDAAAFWDVLHIRLAYIDRA